MSTLTDTKQRYGYGSIALRWLLAAFVLYLTWTGYEFMILPRGPEKGAALQTHYAAAWIAIVVIIARIAWRLANPLPALTTGPIWQRHAARLVHWSLLVLFVALVITGYMAASAGRQPASVYGMFRLPQIFGTSGQVHVLGEEIHSWVSHLFVALLALHIAAALKRSFLDKDGTLRRMLRVDSAA